MSKEKVNRFREQIHKTVRVPIWNWQDAKSLIGRLFFCVIRGFPRTSSLPQVTSGVQQNTTVVCDEETYPNGGSTGSLLVVR